MHIQNHNSLVNPQYMCVLEYTYPYRFACEPSSSIDITPYKYEWLFQEVLSNRKIYQ
jgi:hypothetical protein